MYQNRVIKERIRAVMQTMSYNQMPKKMKVTPKEIIMGDQKLDYKTVCQLPFRAYTQVHDDLAVTNNMKPWTAGAVNLGPTGNIQGAHRFLSRLTGDMVIHRKLTELPIH